MTYAINVKNNRLCPVASSRIPSPPDPMAGTAVAAWYWSGSSNTNLIGSYSINGWLYYYDTKPDGVSTWITDQAKFFQKDTAIRMPSLTPFFMDAIWPDTWPAISDRPATDLFLGDVQNAVGRLSIARHPLQRKARAVSGQRVPGAINMSFVDGHSQKVPLQKIKNVLWHKDYVPTDDPWKTSP